ncbi:MAG: ATP-binding protein [Victivallales bacterium]|nr:ATP-binding protein [Victivallales bacterium]
MKNLTTSIYDFEKLRKAGYLYVDKTEYLWRLIDPPGESFFLSRPRRFGKSLLVSTLKNIFQGKKELFKGLALYNKPYDWRQYPVIHLDMANCDSKTPEELQVFLEHLLNVSAQELGLEVREQGLAARFENLICDAAKSSTTGQVIILVDEYDKPILNNVVDLPLCKEILPVLKGFYSSIKKCSGVTRLTLVTGVSKFCHVSLFSELNNLTDITMDVDYAGMLGFTEEEVRKNFADRIDEAAKSKGIFTDELMRMLLVWYDGYRFSKADIHVCNPVSISNFFEKKFEFDNYWGTTGVTTVLFEMAKTTRFNFEQALTTPVSSLAFGAYEVENIGPLGLLWQTGYLTIKEVLPGPVGSSMFKLGFPDHEVEDAFNTQLLAYYSGYKDAAMSSLVFRLTDAMRHDDVELFMVTLQSYFASIPYDIRGGDEHYYQTIFFITFLLLGSSVKAESRTNQGRIDAYIRTTKAVYIFEFKLDRNADVAVAQILDRRYYEKFQGCDLPIRLIGVDFDASRGRINGWKEGTLAAGQRMQNAKDETRTETALP